MQGQVNKLVSETWKLTWEKIFNGLETILALIIGGHKEDINLSCEEKVPRFWAETTNKDVIITDIIVLGVGVCFGAFHCIAWLFSFPTHAELLIWRISSVAIKAVPIYIPSMLFLAGLLGGLMDSQKFGDIVAYFSILSGGILYIIARVVTLALAFTSLRDLLPRAYKTVHWTTFIPHV